jgi:hypothetical protein
VAAGSSSFLRCYLLGVNNPGFLAFKSRFHSCFPEFLRCHHQIDRAVRFRSEPSPRSFALFLDSKFKIPIFLLS